MLAPFPRPVEDAPQGGRAPSLRTLLDAESDALSWTPQLLGKVSAWWKHVPFAFWLVSVTKPRVIVELGTHNGISYAAFCEAVVRQNLVTQCFAVDTWKGDEQAGFYGEDAFEDLNTLNAGHYGAFSELLRMTFDEACDTFADGSIDLLHIDGFHSYEAVKHDFATWRRKLSSQAVVLLHDTNVHQSDFGVHRLFRELAQGLPSFEFFHGHGLGLLAIGNKPPAVVTDLCGQLAERGHQPHPQQILPDRHALARHVVDARDPERGGEDRAADARSLERACRAAWLGLRLAVSAAERKPTGGDDPRVELA